MRSDAGQHGRGLQVCVIPVDGEVLEAEDVQQSDGAPESFGLS